VHVESRHFVLSLLLIVAVGSPVSAAILPPDRADALYHSYDGGGVEVSGPSILVRKSVGGSVSAYANYYVDNVSSASIDVITTASPYTEQRTETSVGFDYLHDKTTMSLGYTTSSESDYDADTLSFNISQDLFGDLTTVSLGYSRGDNTVRNNSDPNFEEATDTRSYRLTLSQVLTKNLILGVAFETISDEGFLNNPYRSVRYLDIASPTGYSYQAEVYPRTRTSNALALRLRRYLPWRASVYGGYRLFRDSWGIEANTADLGYVHPFGNNWLVEVNYRLYSQTRADFYSDLFPFQDAQNFLARDKELSTFDSRTLSLGASYEFASQGWRFIDRGSLNLYYDLIRFDYQDFRDLSQGGPPGLEPLYSFDATVLRLFVSIWY